MLAGPFGCSEPDILSEVPVDCAALPETPADVVAGIEAGDVDLTESRAGQPTSRLPTGERWVYNLAESRVVPPKGGQMVYPFTRLPVYPFTRLPVYPYTTGAFIALIGVLAGPAASAAEQTEAEAREQDAAILAVANNWTTSEVLDMMDEADAFGALVADVVDTYPNDFSSGVFESSPNGTSTLYFKGAVPAGVAVMVTDSGLAVNTVASTGKNHLEWEQQVEGLTDFLEGENLDDFLVTFDSVGTVEVVIGGGELAPTLPQNLSGNVSISLDAGPVLAFHADVLGGAQMRLVNGATVCTSAWNVTRTELTVTTEGTTTAGHCTNVARVDDVTGWPVSTTPVAQHLGSHGDVEWHTVSAPLPAKFHATAMKERSVASVKTRWSRNDPTCVFGRSTGVRLCDRVFRTSVNGRVDGVTIRRLVAVHGDGSQPGDSGGGWSISNEAHGIHSGSAKVAGAERDVFSRAEHLPDALDGVEVKLAP